MDREVTFIFSVLTAFIAFMLLYYGRPDAREKLYAGKKAKQFFVRSFTGGWMAMRGPFSLYTTDDGIWMGMLQKHFYPYSDIQSVRKGQGGLVTMLDNTLTLKTGKSYWFSFMRNNQKQEFFKILEAKGVTITEDDGDAT